MGQILREAILVSILTGLLLMSAVTPVAGQAFGVVDSMTITPSCGANIGPGEFRLGADVGLCGAEVDGLILAGNTRLDLNGHTISGSASAGSPPAEAPTTGIQMHGNSKVKGPGAITGFNTGIAIGSSCSSRANNSEVRNVALVGATDFPRSDDQLPAGLATLGNGVSIWGSLNRIRESTIEHYPGFGAFIFCGNQNDIRRNTITFNNGHVESGGVRLQDGLNRVEDNTISKNGDEGILQVTGSENRFIHNTMDNNAFTGPNGQVSIGIVINGGDGHRVQANTITGHNAIGIFVGVSTSDTIKGNTSLNNPDATDMFDSNSDCDNNDWQNNAFNTSNQSCIS